MSVDIATLALRVDALEVKTAGKALDELSQKGAKAEKATLNLASAAKTAAAAFGAFKIVQLAKDAALLAARFETMGVVMRVAGNNAGYTGAEMEKFSKALQKSGISMLQSRDALTQLATANIDLAKAAKLGRAAQDLAVVGNINSSDAMARLIHGIKSAQVETLRTIGLNVNFEDGYKKLAAELGKNVTQLTNQEKALARTNTVLEGSARYVGIYEESMTTAGKAMGSLTRWIENLKIMAGEAVLPALADGVFKLTDALKAANVELDKAGSAGTISSIGGGLNAAFRVVYETVTILGANISYVFAGIGRDIGGVAAMAAAILSGEFTQAGVIRRQMTAANVAAEKALDAFTKKIMENSEATKANSTMTEEQRIAAAKAAKDSADAQEKAEAAASARADAAKKAAEEYKRMIDSANKYIESLKAETLALSMNEDQKIMVKAAEEAAKVSKASLREEIMATAQALVLEKTRIDEAVEAEQKRIDQTDAYIKRLDDSAIAESASYKALNDKIRAIEDEAATLSMSDEQLREHLMLLELQRSGLQATSSEYDNLKTRMEAAFVKLDSANALKDLDDYLDPSKAKSFGDALSNSFGKAGTAIGKMAGAFDKYAQKQAEFDKHVNALSPEDRIKRETELSKKQSEIQVGAYADMAGAAKEYFDEGSTGYKAMHAIEQGFRAYQMAASIAAMIQGTVETTTSVAQSGTKAAASTTAGVAKAFEQLGVWGFVGAAAIIAFMASMGVRGGGGGGASMSAIRQEEQGTGTVLGDADAQSESLSNALALLADVNTLTMRYSARMAKSLQNIEIALTGVSSMIYRTPGLTSGNISGVQEMSKTGTLGFSSKSVSVSDTGLTYQGRLADIEEGLQAFTDITTKKSSWWGLSKSTSTSTVLTDASDDISQQFGLIFQNISDSLVAAGAGVFGKSADLLESQIADIEIDLGMVSLKGLKGDELEEALNAVISAAADDIAMQVLPGLDKYQQVGEGYYETAVRVAYSTEVVQASLDVLGKGFDGAAMEIVDFSQSLINAFGDLETLTDAVASYYDAFYSEEEKLANTTASLTAGFASLGMVMPETAAEFRSMVDALDMTTAAGQEAFVAMMGMSQAFATVAEAAEAARDAYIDELTDAVDAAYAALERSVEAQRDLITEAYEQQSAAISASIETVSESVNKLKALSDALRRTVTATTPTSYAASNRVEAQAQISAALAIAKAGGVFPEADSLDWALGVLAKDAQDQFATRADYLRDNQITANEMTALADLTDEALTIDERSLNALRDQLALLEETYNAEMMRLDGILDQAQAQIDAVLGVDNSVKSVEQAVRELESAIYALASATAPPSSAAAAASTGVTLSDVSAYGEQYGDDAYYLMAGINDLSAKVDAYTNIANLTGMTMQEAIKLGTGASLEYWQEVQAAFDAGLNPTTTSIPKYASGGLAQPGWAMVGEEGPELVNFSTPGRVYTASETRGMMSGNNAELIAEIKALREEIRAGNMSIAATSSKTARVLDRWDGDGIPAERVL